MEFQGKTLEICHDKNIAPPNLEGGLVYLMKYLAQNAKPETENLQ